MADREKVGAKWRRGLRKTDAVGRLAKAKAATSLVTSMKGRDGGERDEPKQRFDGQSTCLRQ